MLIKPATARRWHAAAKHGCSTCGWIAGWRRPLLWLLCGMVVAGCGPSALPNNPTIGAASPAAPRSQKSIVISTLNAVAGFGPMEGSAANGGWGPLADVHSNALFTTEATSRKVVGMLAERVP